MNKKGRTEMSNSGTGTGTGTTPTSLALSFPPSEQLCYVHCNFCDTVLAVSVPSSSLLKMVTVRCGHCGNLLPLNIPHLLLPNSFVPPASHHLIGGRCSPAPNFSVSQTSGAVNCITSASSSRGGTDQHPRPSTSNRPPEKRQRPPSAYNRFIKDEIQRIKAGNPDISHREAFSAAAKNWAHFPHIQFGLMPDQTAKRTSSSIRPRYPQDAGEDIRMKTGYFTASTDVGVSP